MFQKSSSLEDLFRILPMFPPFFFLRSVFKPSLSKVGLLYCYCFWPSLSGYYVITTTTLTTTNNNNNSNAPIGPKAVKIVRSLFYSHPLSRALTVDRLSSACGSGSSLSPILSSTCRFNGRHLHSSASAPLPASALSAIRTFFFVVFFFTILL